MTYKISNDLTPDEINNIVTTNPPPLRKPIQTVMNAGKTIAGGALAAGATLGNIKMRSDAVKTIK